MFTIVIPISFHEFSVWKSFTVPHLQTWKSPCLSPEHPCCLWVATAVKILTFALLDTVAATQKRTWSSSLAFLLLKVVIVSLGIANTMVQ